MKKHRIALGGDRQCRVLLVELGGLLGVGVAHLLGRCADVTLASTSSTDDQTLAEKLHAFNADAVVISPGDVQSLINAEALAARLIDFDDAPRRVVVLSPHDNTAYASRLHRWVNLAGEDDLIRLIQGA